MHAFGDRRSRAQPASPGIRSPAIALPLASNAGVLLACPRMSEPRPTIYLVDGSGYIFRAFYALPQLTTSRGQPTNAIYGFLRMLLKLLKDAHPEFLAIVFDAPARTFRDDLFESYKANRAAPANDLVVQIPYIHRLVEAFRIKQVTQPGYEADDVIGTLAVRAAREGADCVIITADKDFMQLVGPRISLWDTMRDRRFGPREVRERLGVEARSVVDLMALTGDPIDNIKGVPGIGPKTATDLIRRFGSLDAILADPGAVRTSSVRAAAKLAELIAQHRADAELARKLVTIHTDVPLSLRLDQLAFNGIDYDSAAAFLRELEFTSVLAELTPAQVSQPEAAAGEKEVSGEEAAAWLSGARSFALHMDSNRLKLAQHPAGEVIVVSSGDLGALKPLLESSLPPRACHDLKTQMAALSRFGIRLAGVDFDTMLAGFLISPGRPEPGLEDLYHEHLAPLGGQVRGSEPEIIASLRPVMEQRLEADGLGEVFRTVEMPLAVVLHEMERTGIGIDAEALGAISREFAQQLEQLEAQCFELAGRKFNLNSPNQLRDVLFTDLKLPTKGIKRTKSGFSTDVDVLTKLAALHPLPGRLLEYRTIAKLKSTYVDALPAAVDPATGRLHTSFHQALTATGRLSSTQPNLQNIPTRSAEGRRIRRAFVAPAGAMLLSADYSQIELRVLAHLSADPVLTRAFANNEDIHLRTATEVLGIAPEAVDAEARRLAKVINFGIIYGMGPQRLAGELGIPLTQASEYIERYFKRLPGVSAYLENCLHEARERGYVATMLGRRRYLPELASPQGGARAQAERIAINTPIQGTAADLIKIAMIRVRQQLVAREREARMVLQVHDELLFEAGHSVLPQIASMVREQMENVAALRVPLRVEIKTGPNWAELAPWRP